MELLLLFRIPEFRSIRISRGYPLCQKWAGSIWPFWCNAGFCQTDLHGCSAYLASISLCK